MRKKRFQELNLSDAFLLVAAMSDPENCRLMMEMILGIPIDHLTVHSEHNILFSSDYKSVRLDVFASDEVEVDYDVEMQNEEEEYQGQQSGGDSGGFGGLPALRGGQQRQMCARCGE